jgi:hypothetical protein
LQHYLLITKKTMQNQIGLLAKVGVVAGGCLIFVGSVYMLGGQTASAEVLNAQERVQAAQEWYDEARSSYWSARTEYCQSWKALAGSKQDLAQRVNIPYPVTQEQLDKVDCTNFTPEASF